MTHGAALVRSLARNRYILRCATRLLRPASFTLLNYFLLSLPQTSSSALRPALANVHAYLLPVAQLSSTEIAFPQPSSCLEVCRYLILVMWHVRLGLSTLYAFNCPLCDAAMQRCCLLLLLVLAVNMITLVLLLLPLLQCEFKRDFPVNRPASERERASERVSDQAANQAELSLADCRLGRWQVLSLIAAMKFQEFHMNVHTSVSHTHTLVIASVASNSVYTATRMCN